MARGSRRRRRRRVLQAGAVAFLTIAFSLSVAAPGAIAQEPPPTPSPTPEPSSEPSPDPSPEPSPEQSPSPDPTSSPPPTSSRRRIRHPHRRHEPSASRRRSHHIRRRPGGDRHTPQHGRGDSEPVRGGDEPAGREHGTGGCELATRWHRIVVRDRRVDHRRAHVIGRWCDPSGRSPSTCSELACGSRRWSRGPERFSSS